MEYNNSKPKIPPLSVNQESPPPDKTPAPEPPSNPVDCMRAALQKFKGPEPYPKVTGKDDPETVAMLKEDYAGRISELTAVVQYTYQDNASSDESFSAAILKIAVTEMTHLDMLGEAIVTLGGNPEYTAGGNYWSAAFANYTSDMEGILRADIASEEGAIASYRLHAEKTENSSVRALLLRIIEDEIIHLEFFRNSLEKLVSKR